MYAHPQLVAFINNLVMLEMSYNFKLCMVISVVVSYDLESVATLYRYQNVRKFILNMLILTF